MGVTYHRFSAHVIRDKRWPALRLAAKRRDNFKCVQCPAVGRLEVDHIKPVRTHPELAFTLENLQTLCIRCHSAKTKQECGFGNEVTPARAAWRDLVATMAKPTQKELLNVAEC